MQLRAAEAALARGDFAAAESELEAARRLAPWDRGVADFSSRIGEARARAQRDSGREGAVGAAPRRSRTT